MNIKLLLQCILIGIVMTVIFILLKNIANVNVPTWLGVIIIGFLISFFSRINK